MQREETWLFKAESDLSFSEIAPAQGLSAERLRQMNPLYVAGIIPGRSKAR